MVGGTRDSSRHAADASARRGALVSKGGAEACAGSASCAARAATLGARRPRAQDRGRRPDARAQPSRHGRGAGQLGVLDEAALERLADSTVRRRDPRGVEVGQSVPVVRAGAVLRAGACMDLTAARSVPRAGRCARRDERRDQGRPPHAGQALSSRRGRRRHATASWTCRRRTAARPTRCAARSGTPRHAPGPVRADDAGATPAPQPSPRRPTGQPADNPSPTSAQPRRRAYRGRPARCRGGRKASRAENRRQPGARRPRSNAEPDAPPLAARAADDPPDRRLRGLQPFERRGLVDGRPPYFRRGEQNCRGAASSVTRAPSRDRRPGPVAADAEAARAVAPVHAATRAAVTPSRRAAAVARQPTRTPPVSRTRPSRSMPLDGRPARQARGCWPSLRERLLLRPDRLDAAGAAASAMAGPPRRPATILRRAADLVCAAPDGVDRAWCWALLVAASARRLRRRHRQPGDPRRQHRAGGGARVRPHPAATADGHAPSAASSFWSPSIS